MLSPITQDSSISTAMQLESRLLPQAVIFGFLLIPQMLHATPNRNSSDQDKTLPNIVMIVADDHHWSDFGFMGNERVHTPHLDALAARSAKFPNGYVPSSVCRPSLASILTGLYPHQHGIYFNHGPPGNAGYNKMTSRKEYELTRQNEFQWIKRLQTIPKTLAKNKGYRCLQTGKFWEGHFQNAGFTEGMTTFSPPPRDQTYGGIRTLANGELVAHGNGDFGLSIGRKTMLPIKEFIAQCEREQTPWLVWYAPYLPHLPHDAPEPFQKLASNRQGVLPWEQPYFASISQFDASVGELQSIVKTHSKPNQTLFIFLTDNGWRPSSTKTKHSANEFSQTKRSKRSPFDDGLRTPLLICWDGQIRPQTRTGLVSSVDLLPTLFSAVGISKSEWQHLPGIDLFGLLRSDRRIPKDRSVFGEIYPGDASSLGRPQNDIAYRWIRQGSLKLIVPHSQQRTSEQAASISSLDLQTDSVQAWNGYVNSETLFDLSIDPFEKLNLANSARFQIKRKQLRDLINQWWNPAISDPPLKLNSLTE